MDVIPTDSNISTHRINTGQVLNRLKPSLIINSHKVRAVHNFDVPGAYLHASLPGKKKVIMKI